MNGYSASAAPPGGMYVRALYDYEADDRTSLSFRQGDIIQVITQLESGWWDGVINGTRGWFPSNYCAVVPRPSDDDSQDESRGLGDGDLDDGLSSDPDESHSDTASLGENGDSTRLPIEGTENHDQEEAAFWIPQATPDGRLFYFNTLTGVSTMELPLETPTSSMEAGPRDRTNIYIPEQTRPPPELLAGGYMTGEDTDDYSESEGPMIASRSSLPSRRRSFSNGISPATSMDSMNATSPKTRSRADTHDQSAPSFSVAQSTMGPLGTTTTSFANNSIGGPMTSAMSRQFFDNAHAIPLTWNRMVEDMRRSVERYRRAVNNSDRSEFVKRAEDISDHLRLILSAGSGTTDNHSGNPSIISTNKALYPHFRETMSRFSKLVLSSHIAAADWPPPDSYAKCLKEADGVLNGVFGFVEVARQQRGEEIPRLIPGFVLGITSGGSWQNNGLTAHDSAMSLSFIDQDDYEPLAEPNARLDTKLLERLEDLKRLITTSIRKLDEHLVLREKLVTPARQTMIGDNICKACSKVLEFYRPWISTVESINLTPLGSAFQNPQLADFAVQKQKIYDLMTDLVMACQAVSAPLADEWAEVRIGSLDERLKVVRGVSKELDTCTSQLYFSLQLLSEMVPSGNNQYSKEEHRKTDGGATYQNHLRNPSNSLQRPLLGDVGQSHSFTEGIAPAPVAETYRNGDNAKVKKFFGEVPVQPSIEETPEYLKLDHEGEIAFDQKTNPPQLRGGTLTALVEQLTRHDRLDSPFNNTFLLTYRSFTTASELFEMLVKRWSIQPPYGLPKEHYQHWVDKKQKPIRFRVVNILKSWFDNYWMEGNDEAARQLIQRVYNFAKDHVATTSTPGAQPLMAAVEQRAKGQDMPSKRLVLTLNTQTPQPIMPKNLKKLKFLDIDTTEFARQLTIIESRLYGKIRPTECLNKTWSKKLGPNEPDPAPNVKALILHSNQLTNWVAQMILTQTEVKKRVVVIKQFVAIADKCRALNNFSTLTSIISALGSAPIHRLNRTWNAVNARTMSTLESMRKLMGSTKNFLEYRDTLHKANPPCIPFFGVYLTDLTFIEDGIPSIIKKTNLINFAKRAKTAEVIRDVQQYQNVPYPLQPVPELQDYILTNMQSAGDVHEMYDQSLAVEPREREDEKIAR
ncbi:guanine-nucleotide dissociation stimulator CDC25 [Patellaria atrata CBS 101060]|uniref:Class E vacuolar protein-sorting machinery protein HSE1 n=1 Tax=Patellaria atrata CBS 101060 TaxID=1346257 RepID=A0A9P4VNU4_9PEZI|nr:guanine-nucleotide dissociation stimulator CDC25 [Patellaria atrata CBS 101060]